MRRGMRKGYLFYKGDIVMCIDATLANGNLELNKCYVVEVSDDYVKFKGTNTRWLHKRFKRTGVNVLTKLQKVIYEIT